MKNICAHPFNMIQIQNTGDIYCCCCYWTNFYSFGNIFEQSFDEIWNGEKAQNFRKQFIENNYNICKLNECSPAKADFEPSLIADYPKHIEFSYDRRCNVRCIFCRNKPNKEEEEYNRNKEKRIEENFDKIFTPLIQNAELIDMNSAGELFASKHSIEILKKIIKINPNIIFNIISNGTLFSKKMIEELGLKNRMNTVIISIHASNEKTYNKLVENGNYKNLIENVKYLAELKKEGYIQTLQLNFVITSINYKEMKDFALFAKSLGAKAFFINYHRQIDSDEFEKEMDVTKPEHSKYNHFVKLIQDPIFKEDFCVVSSNLFELKQKKTTIIEKIKNLFKQV